MSAGIVAIAARRIAEMIQPCWPQVMLGKVTSVCCTSEAQPFLCLSLMFETRFDVSDALYSRAIKHSLQPG